MLVEELEYSVTPPNRAQFLVQTIASTRSGSWILARTVRRFDLRLFRWTGGRRTIPGVFAGLNVLLLHTQGANTGLRRVAPVVGLPFGDGLAVIGSNYGQRNTPSWVHNLRATPRADIEYGGKSISIISRLATGEERKAVFRLAEDIYRGFNVYRQRAAHREVKVFVLQAATDRN